MKTASSGLLATFFQSFPPIPRGLCALLGLLASSGHLRADSCLETDICVYGGSAGGVAAAVAAARRGADVVVIEPLRQLGGMHGGGIRLQRDCLYLKDIGGLAKELHVEDRRLPGEGQFANQWAGRLMLRRRLESAGVRYFTQYRLDNRTDVVVKDRKITLLNLNYAPVDDDGVPPAKPIKIHALSVKAKVFIDASYEGDLMAFAGCAYAVGREGRDRYQESLAGQGKLRIFDVDPYATPGDPKSGLLPLISPEPYEPGMPSRYMMAYNFRLNGLRDDLGNDGSGTPIKPLGREVDSKRYALVIRALESKKARTSVVWPEWNYARTAMISSSPPGIQADYPEADWGTRSGIWRESIDHVKTMNQLCGLKNPVLFKGEYPDTADFPDQLYVRTARRLIGEYVVTQQDLMHQREVTDSIGLAYYYVDIYPPRLICHEGKVASEGEMFVRVCPGPFPISYRALIPKREQCSNLLVPVCMSASHVAMAAIRMESSFVVMGEAAGAAAAQAARMGVDCQKLDWLSLESDLRGAGVITKWNGTGYGPNPKGQPEVYWLTHPNEYKAKPIRLDPSWHQYQVRKGVPNAFDSAEAWARANPGSEWLFEFMDSNRDGHISEEENVSFEAFKKSNPDWATKLKLRHPAQPR